MTARIAINGPALHFADASVIARLVERLDAACARARARAELRRRLRIDAHLCRDIGLSGFDTIRLLASH
jgi:hypothetical protein